jgi:hypothetical protein
MSGLASLHKILKDETRQEIITLLNEKGCLSYSDLKEDSEVLSTGLLNYHLKVLGDLLEKNENSQYMLNERGRLAYRLLTEFSNEKSSEKKPKWWRVYWATIVVLTILAGLTLTITASVPFQEAVFLTTLALLALALAYIIRVKQSLALNRIIYIIFIGIPIGGTLWLTLLLTHSFGLGTNQNLPLIISSIIVCFSVGSIIGDLIGRSRGYKGPEKYQP